MKSRQANAPSGRTPPSIASAAPGASRAACSASPGRSSVFDGMQAQYEHSPPSSSRSTIATFRPPSARWLRAVLAGRPASENDHVVAHRPAASFASSIAFAAVISPMWLNACGTLPSISPLFVSISSASRPTSFA